MKTDKPTLTLTVGLPRSGKSTWAQTQDAPIVSPDSIRKALGCFPFVPTMEPYVWAITRTMVKALFASGHSRVILDATNCSAQRREEWRSKEWNRDFAIFKTPVTECKKRAFENGQLDLLPVIARMEKAFKESEDDAFSDIAGLYRETIVFVP